MTLPLIVPPQRVVVTYHPTTGNVEIEAPVASADVVILALVKALYATLAKVCTVGD